MLKLIMSLAAALFASAPLVASAFAALPRLAVGGALLAAVLVAAAMARARTVPRGLEEGLLHPAAEDDAYHRVGAD